MPGGVIYLVRCRANGKGYVGKTTKGVEARWATHVAGAAKMAEGRYRGRGSTALWSAITKYGADAFEIIEIGRADTKEAINAMERAMIAKHGTLTPSGYNLTKGGDGVAMVGEALERRNAAIKAALANPEVKARQSAGTKAALANPEVKARHKAALANPEVKACLTAANRAKAADPKWRASTTAAQSRPDVKARKSASLKQRAANPRTPEERAQRGAEALAALEKMMAPLCAEARAAGARGVMPAAPNFSAPTHKPFRARLAALVAMVEAGDLDGLRAFPIDPVTSSRQALARYRALAVAALEGAAEARALPMVA